MNFGPHICWPTRTHCIRTGTRMLAKSPLNYSVSLTRHYNQIIYTCETIWCVPNEKSRCAIRSVVSNPHSGTKDDRITAIHIRTDIEQTYAIIYANEWFHFTYSERVKRKAHTGLSLMQRSLPMNECLRYSGWLKRGVCLSRRNIL